MKNVSQSRVLFILKFRDNANEYGYGGYGRGISSGLLNSVKFIVEMLVAEGVEAKYVQVVDNNSIDREVSLYKPTDVIIEALWVVPEKFNILQKLHPNVNWVVRGHSEIPFLAHEGIAIEWLLKYVQFDNVRIAANSEASLRDLRIIVASSNPEWSEWDVEDKVIYLPNFYAHKRHKGEHPKDGYLNIACFGAIRPLKNQLIQAVAAIEYANLMGKTLRFHVNAGRTEQGGDTTLKNLRALFANTPHTLVEHGWLPHDKFLKILTLMDASMCVSFSESFCIVAADSIVCNVPLVGSAEISFLNKWAVARPTDSQDIVKRLITVLDWKRKPLLRAINFNRLKKSSEQAKRIWMDLLTY